MAPTERTVPLELALPLAVLPREMSLAALLVVRADSGQPLSLRGLPGRRKRGESLETLATTLHLLHAVAAAELGSGVSFVRLMATGRTAFARVREGEEQVFAVFEGCPDREAGQRVAAWYLALDPAQRAAQAAEWAKYMLGELPWVCTFSPTPELAPGQGWSCWPRRTRTHPEAPWVRLVLGPGAQAGTEGELCRELSASGRPDAATLGIGGTQCFVVVLGDLRLVAPAPTRELALDWAARHADYCRLFLTPAARTAP